MAAAEAVAAGAEAAAAGGEAVAAVEAETWAGVPAGGGWEAVAAGAQVEACRCMDVVGRVRSSIHLCEKTAVRTSISSAEAHIEEPAGLTLQGGGAVLLRLHLPPVAAPSKKHSLPPRLQPLHAAHVREDVF